MTFYHTLTIGAVVSFSYLVQNKPISQHHQSCGHLLKVVQLEESYISMNHGEPKRQAFAEQWKFHVVHCKSNESRISSLKLNISRALL